MLTVFPKLPVLADWLLSFFLIAVLLWAVLVAVPAAIHFLLDPDRRRAAVRAAVCVVAHRPYAVRRVPDGFADWMDVCCCPKCGDRWCRRV